MLQEIKEIHILHLEWVTAHSIFFRVFPYSYVLLPIVWFSKLIQVQLDSHWGLICKVTCQTL